MSSTLTKETTKTMELALKVHSRAFSVVWIVFPSPATLATSEREDIMKRYGKPKKTVGTDIVVVC